MAASPTARQFIELALSSNSPFNLSYSDPHQKWLIRKHLLSFLQDFPSFSPTFGTFVHDDGTAATLFRVAGDLRVSAAPSLVSLTIWLHQNHPLMAPMVFVVSADPIRPDHPFVNPRTGSAATCPYLQTWAHPRSSLSTLVRNLARLFSHDHPLVIPSFSPAPVPATATNRSGSGFAHPSLASKREALDRLAGRVHYDLAVINGGARREIEELTKLHVEVAERVRAAERVVNGLEEEKKRLKERAMELAEQSDVVTNWLRVNDPERLAAAIGDEEVEKAFEAEPEAMVEWLAADIAVEDVIYALDKAVQRGVMGFEAYIKQVRILAREQFYHRTRLIELRGSAILHLTH